MRDLPELGQKVRALTDVLVYEIRKGDIGEVIELHTDRGPESYIVCRWQKDDKRDLGWWIEQPYNTTCLNILRNLEVVWPMDDTREYLETVSSLA